MKYKNKDSQCTPGKAKRRPGKPAPSPVKKKMVYKPQGR